MRPYSASGTYCSYIYNKVWFSFGYKTVCTLYEAVLVTKIPPTLTAEFCNCKPDQIFHNPYFASHSYYLSCTAWDRHSTSWYTYCCFTGPYIRKYTASLLGRWFPLIKSKTSCTIHVREYCTVNLDIIMTVTCTQFS